MFQGETKSSGKSRVQLEQDGDGAAQTPKCSAEGFWVWASMQVFRQEEIRSSQDCGWGKGFKTIRYVVYLPHPHPQQVLHKHIIHSTNTGFSTIPAVVLAEQHKAEAPAWGLWAISMCTSSRAQVLGFSNTCQPWLDSKNPAIKGISCSD